MSTRLGQFAIVLALVASSSSCLTVITKVKTAPGSGDVCSEEPGKIPCDRDCNSFEDCKTPNNCCRGLCDEFQED